MLKRSTLTLIAFTLLFAFNASAEDIFQKAFEDSRAWLNFRYRYELGELDSFEKDARASTLRSRLGLETGAVHGFSALAEIEDVSPIGSELYNSTTNGITDRPVVVDPDGTEVNQAYLQYKGLAESHFRVGRYELNLDNQRFIGSVAWRQNNQTLDGVHFKNSYFEDVTFQYAYASNINRIFGDDSPNGDLDSNLNIFHVGCDALEGHSFSTYAYLLDIGDAPALSSTTFGVRGSGKFGVTKGVKIPYEAEYAYQQDYDDNPNDYSANYFHVNSGVSFAGVTLKGGFEHLGSDDSLVGFSTPLATAHKFNGFADLFLSTPAEGLQDAYATVKYKVDGVHEYLDGLTLAVTYHDFQSDEGSLDYGDEWDVVVSKLWNKRYLTGIKYANYEAEDFGTDTERLIFTLGAKFSTDDLKR